MGERRFWIVVAVLALLGLALRIAAAQGALWLDEAWSAVMAAQVRTPLGVFLQINHDNNHHMNTLWLQLVGLDAPPVWQRGLAILTGTAAIPLATAIARRQSQAAALCAALLFAISPLLVIYGAEARGYAPMVLALLIALLLTARWLDEPARPVPAAGLFVTVLLGMYSQMTMAFGVAALAVWAGWVLYRALPRREAVAAGRRLLVPLLFPVVMVPALVLGAAGASGTGFQLGNSDAFKLAVAADGIMKMAVFAIGIGVVLVPVFVVQGIAYGLGGGMRSPGPSSRRKPGSRCRELHGRETLGPGFRRDDEREESEQPPRPSRRSVFGRPWYDSTWIFFALAALIPLGVVVLGLPNAGMPRYHLIAGVALVMLLASLMGEMFRQRWRVPAMIALTMIAGAMLMTDRRIILDQRADPGRAVAAMADKSFIAVDRPRAAAVMEAAIASGHRTLTVAEAPCPPARYLFVDRDGDEPFPAAPVRCGVAYRPILEGHPQGLSGTHWKLYERAPIGAEGRPCSSPFSTSCARPASPPA